MQSGGRESFLFGSPRSKWRALASIVLSSLTIASTLVVSSWGYCEDYLSPTTLANRGGTARTLGLAGATLALPQNGGAFADNPAAIPYQMALIDGVLSYGRSRGEKPSNPSVRTLADESWVAGTSLLAFDNIGLGVGILSQTTRSERTLAANSRLGLASHQREISAAASVRLFDELSLGFSVVHFSSEQSRLHGDKFGMAKTSALQNYSGFAPKASLLYAADKNFSLAASYQKDANLTPQNPLRLAGKRKVPGLYLPARARLALAYLLPSQGAASQPSEAGLTVSGGEVSFFLENTFCLELEIVHFPSLKGSDRLFEPSALILDNNPKGFGLTEKAAEWDRLAVVKQARFVPKLAVESAIFRTPALALTTWMGTYYEPRTTSHGEAISHVTVGVKFVAWYVAASAALDFAKEHNNQTFELGLDFTL